MGIGRRLAWLFRVKANNVLDRSAPIAGGAATAATPAVEQNSTAASAAHGTPQLPEASTLEPTRKDIIRLLIEEGLVVRERLDGHIDAATYRSRMHDLASGRRT